MRPGTRKVTGLGSMDNVLTGGSASLWENMQTFFQAEVYAILDCVHKIETQERPEKYVSIRSENQAVLKAKRTSPLVRKCQQALHHISTRHDVGLY